MTPSELQHLRSLCEQATPEVVDALRNCVRFWVSTWYATADGGDAEAKPDSAAMRAVDTLDAARSAVPALIEEVERLQREQRDSLTARLAEVEAEYERMRGVIATARGQIDRVKVGFTGMTDTNAEVVDGFYRGALSAIDADLDAALSTTPPENKP